MSAQWNGTAWVEVAKNGDWKVTPEISNKREKKPNEKTDEEIRQKGIVEELRRRKKTFILIYSEWKRAEKKFGKKDPLTRDYRNRAKAAQIFCRRIGGKV